MYRSVASVQLILTSQYVTSWSAHEISKSATYRNPHTNGSLLWSLSSGGQWEAFGHNASTLQPAFKNIKVRFGKRFSNHYRACHMYYSTIVIVFQHRILGVIASSSASLSDKMVYSVVIHHVSTCEWKISLISRNGHIIPA